MDAVPHCYTHFLRRESSPYPTRDRLTTLPQLFLDLIYLPETYAPVLLSTKAMKLRKSTNRWALHSRHEMNDFSITNFLENNLTRPLRMLVKEPMVLAITTFNAFTYGILCEYQLQNDVMEGTFADRTSTQIFSSVPYPSSLNKVPLHSSSLLRIVTDQNSTPRQRLDTRRSLPPLPRRPPRHPLRSNYQPSLLPLRLRPSHRRSRWYMST